MMQTDDRNLRYRGFPDSRSSDRRTMNLMMTDERKPNVVKNTPLLSPQRRSDFQKLTEGIAEAYNYLHHSDPKNPQAQTYSSRTKFTYHPPANYTNGLTIEPENGGKKIMLTEHVKRGGMNSYSAALDGLYSIFGDESKAGTVSTPLGKLSGAYNGDVLYGHYDPPQLNYYLEAIRRMLSTDRGTL